MKPPAAAHPESYLADLLTDSRSGPSLDPRTAYNKALDALCKQGAETFAPVAGVEFLMATALTLPEIRRWVHRDPQARPFRNNKEFQRITGAASPERYWDLPIFKPFRLELSDLGFRTVASLEAMDDATRAAVAKSLSIAESSLTSIASAARVVARIEEVDLPDHVPGGQSLSYCRADLAEIIIDRGGAMSSTALSDELALMARTILEKHYPAPIGAGRMVTWITSLRPAATTPSPPPPARYDVSLTLGAAPSHS